MKDIRENWKALAAARKIQSEDIAALCIYRSLLNNPYDGVRLTDAPKVEAITRLQKAFQPITNSIKLQNGEESFSSLRISLRLIKKSTFLTWLNEEEQTAILSIAKSITVAGGEIK